MGHLSLIPGLPDEIALDCLARVPHRFHAGLRPVCRGWRDLITSPSFYRLRKSVRTAEDLIYLVQALDGAADPDTAGESKEQKNGGANFRPPMYSLSLYNATLGSWHRLHPATASIPMFSQCAAIPAAAGGGAGKLVVVGGWDPVTFDPVPDVHVLDLASGAWRRGAPMSVARSFFACAAVAGRVYVAGGHDGQKNALRSAEVYDMETDEWAALPPMEEERDECKGVSFGGKFWAVSGYRTESQGRFDPSAECYDPAKGVWSKEEGMWEVGGAAPCAACFGVDGGMLWCLDGGGMREYEWRERRWRVVGPVPEGLRSGTCAAAIGSGERVFVMGSEGESGHGGWVLEVGSRKWTRVDTPVGFSGFVYSAASLRL